MNKPILESRKALLKEFCTEFHFYMPCELATEKFLISYEKKQLTESKKRVKTAKKTLTDTIESEYPTVFSDAKAKMKAKGITEIKLAELVGRKQQHINSLLKSKNPTSKSIEMINQAIENYGSTAI